MDSFDRIDALELQSIKTQAYLIYLQSEIEVLRGVFACLSANNRIGDMTVDAYLKDALPKQVRRNLGHISDNNPLLATALEKILADAEKSQDS
jgi:hypothetical protein